MQVPGLSTESWQIPTPKPVFDTKLRVEPDPQREWEQRARTLRHAHWFQINVWFRRVSRMNEAWTALPPHPQMGE